MRFVSLLLTDDQAELLAAAAADAADNEELHEDDRKQFGRLQLLFQDASENPSKYPPTGALAATVRTIQRRVKGAAQPKPLNKRKQRQERRIRTAKERRKLRRQIAESYNAAREIMEAEAREAEALHAEAEERIASQPKYRIVAFDGNTIMDGVPAEFIVREETGENLLPKVIVPGA